jgi:hypothetical protein
MKPKFNGMVAGLVGLLWLASVVFAGSLAAPELDVPKDKAKNQVLTTVMSYQFNQYQSIQFN